MGYQKGKMQDFVYSYSFAVNGGAQGNITLTNQGVNGLESGMIITDFTVVVGTALGSGGTPTITFGNAGTTDGYMIDFYGAASSGAVLNRGDRAGSLVWDDTNDHPIHYKISSSANAAPTITVATADLNAGTFKVYIKAFKPL